MICPLRTTALHWCAFDRSLTGRNGGQSSVRNTELPRSQRLRVRTLKLGWRAMLRVYVQRLPVSRLCTQHQGFVSEVQRFPYDAEQPGILQEQLLQQPTPAPAVVTGAMEAWKARSWSISNLAQYGHQEVPVEVSHSGGDYRDLHARPSSHRHFEADVQLPLSAVLQGMQASIDGQKAHTLLYAAQVDLLSLIPALQDGVDNPPLQVVHDRLYKRNTWLGPSGTITPLHRDPYFNLFCQVWGTKYVRIYDAKHAQQLYPFSNPFLRNTSQVSVENVDTTLFPKFSQVPYFECHLHPGEMLFIPKKHWHFVKALTASWSVSYWWT